MLRPYVIHGLNRMNGLKRDGARGKSRALSCLRVQSHVTQRLSRPRGAYRVLSLLWRIMTFV